MSYKDFVVILIIEFKACLRCLYQYISLLLSNSGIFFPNILSKRTFQAIY